MALNLELSTPDWLICDCGNEPDIDGFYTCQPSGEIVAPDATGTWDNRSYLCFRCGAIYNMNNLEQTGQATDEVMKANYLLGDTSDS